LQHAAELGHGRQTLAFAWRVDLDPPLARPDAKNPAGAAGHVGQVDPVGSGSEFVGLDHFQVGHVVDQCQQVLSGRGDVSRIVRIFVGQGAGHAGADGFGGGNDPRDRLTQHGREIDTDQPMARHLRHLFIGPGRERSQWRFRREQQFEPGRLPVRLLDRNHGCSPGTLRTF
jgi:hypothetical protein